MSDPIFDKQFSIQSSDKRIAQKILDNAELKKLLIDNKSLILNISSQNRITKIIMKNMFQKTYDIEEYKDFIRNMKSIIDIINN